MLNLLVAMILFPVALFAGDLDRFQWLSGCWLGEGEEQVSEHWNFPTQNMMLGISHTKAAGKTVAYEFMRIERKENDDIFFIANPSGQPEAEFKLSRIGSQEAVFENPKHDFPQRVLYRREGDSLRGRIEGISKGKEKGIDFPMKRVACDQIFGGRQK